MNALTRIEAKLEGYIQTLELKFFGGKLAQKWIAGHPGAQPAEQWVEVESHTEEPHAAGTTAAAVPPGGVSAPAGSLTPHDGPVHPVAPTPATQGTPGSMAAQAAGQPTVAP